MEIDEEGAMARSVRLVVAVFTNVLFVLGVIFVVVGLIQGIKIVGYKLLLDEYPTRYGGEDCSYAGQGYPMPVGMEPAKVASGSADAGEVEKQRQSCEVRVARDRQVKQVDDVALAVGMSMSGWALIFLFNPRGRLAVKD